LKLIDNKGRLFGKVNLLDCAVVLIVAAALIGAYLKFGVLQESGTTELQPIRYTAEIANVRDFIFENLQVGDVLYESGGVNIGTIVSLTAAGYKDAIGLTDGTLVTAEVPERYMVLIEVEAEATVVGGRYYIAKTSEIAVGSSRTFLSKYVACSGTVKEISIYGD